MPTYFTPLTGGLLHTNAAASFPRLLATAQLQLNASRKAAMRISPIIAISLATSSPRTRPSHTRTCARAHTLAHAHAHSHTVFIICYSSVTQRGRSRSRGGRGAAMHRRSTCSSHQSQRRGDPVAHGERWSSQEVLA